MGVASRIGKFLDPDSEGGFPAEFDMLVEGHDDGYLSPLFPQNVDWPDTGGILIDDNIIFDHYYQCERKGGARLDDEELSYLMAVAGHVPERKNILDNGKYMFEESYDHRDIEELFETAYQHEVDLYYVGSIGDELVRKGADEENVKRYMNELDKIASPIEVEPPFEDSKMDPGIKLAAYRNNLNVVTADNDFVKRYGLIPDLDVNAYTVPTMLEILRTDISKKEEKESSPSFRQLVSNTLLGD